MLNFGGVCFKWDATRQLATRLFHVWDRCLVSPSIWKTIDKLKATEQTFLKQIKFINRYHVLEETYCTRGDIQDWLAFLRGQDDQFMYIQTPWCSKPCFTVYICIYCIYTVCICTYVYLYMYITWQFMTTRLNKYAFTYLPAEAWNHALLSFGNRSEGRRRKMLGLGWHRGCFRHQIRGCFTSNEIMMNEFDDLYVDNMFH